MSVAALSGSGGFRSQMSAGEGTAIETCAAPEAASPDVTPQVLVCALHTPVRCRDQSGRVVLFQPFRF